MIITGGYFLMKASKASKLFDKLIARIIIDF